MTEAAFTSPLLGLIDSLRSTVESASSDDRVAHESILSQINSLLLKAETPFETVSRIGHQSWQFATVRIAIDLGVFDHIVKAAETRIDPQTLAQETGADVKLIIRLLRLLNTMGFCVIHGDGTCGASSKTLLLTQSVGLDASKFWFDVSMSTAARLPEYFRARGYTNPQQSLHSAFAYQFGSEFWTWMSTHPDQAAVFDRFMASRRQGKPSWFQSYPVNEELLEGLDRDANAVALVDIGGNQGHDLKKLRDAYPELSGKLILQDLPDVILRCDELELKGITTMEHNFFKAQFIKGARAYHFRAIFHDWPDTQCRTILQHTADAMKPGYSKILISEFILSDTKTRLFPACLDVQMMAYHAGMERSYTQWEALLNSAGLVITKVWQKMEGGEGVIEAARKQT